MFAEVSGNRTENSIPDIGSFIQHIMTSVRNKIQLAVVPFAHAFSHGRNRDDAVFGPTKRQAGNVG